MVFLIPNSVLLNSPLVTTILQWIREEEKKSGKKTEPKEDKELDQLLDETIELFDESNKITDQKKLNHEEDAKTALETFKDSAKRNADESKEQDQKRVELVVQTLWLT